MNNNHWENNKCNTTKNVDGTTKTDADYCTGLNNYYKDGVCDVTKDRDGKEKTEEQMCNENSSYYAVDAFKWYNKNKGNQDLINKGMKDPMIASQELSLRSTTGFPSLVERQNALRINERLYTPENSKGIAGCSVKLYPDGSLKGKQEICQSILNGRLSQASSDCLQVEGQYPYNYNQMEEYLKDKQLKFYDFTKTKNARNQQVVSLRDIQGGNKPKSLTLYYADWCPHCHDMMSDWNKLGKQHKGIKIEKFEEKETNFKVDGFPTIIFRNGSKVEKYEGERTKKAIVSYLKNKLK